MTDPNRTTTGTDAAAAQVVDLVIRAAKLLSGGTDPSVLVDEMAETLRTIHGVHDVRWERAAMNRWDSHRDSARPGSDPDRTVHDAQRPLHWLGAASRAGGRDHLVVELAGPRDAEWVDAGQLHRLHAALTVIESAAAAGGERVDGPREWLLRHARSVVVQLMPDRWAVRSDAMTRLLGYPRGALPAEQPLSLVDRRDRFAALRAYVEVLTGRRTDTTIDLRVRGADGSYRVFETTFVDLAGVPGVRSVVLYGLDVTEQRAERARLRELVMRLDGAVLVVDEGGRVRLANDTFTRMFGTRAGGWIAAHQREVLRAIAAVCPDEAATGRRLTSLAGARKRRTVRLDITDGRVVDLDRVPLTERGLDLGSLWHFRDVTAEVVAHADPVSPENQNQVLATVSHELRTPMTAVLSFAELLADPMLGPLNEQQQNACDVIARNTRRLLALVDDLLLLARLESGRLPLRTDQLDIATLVDNAVEDRRLEAGQLGITLLSATALGPPLTGDANRLQQVVDNIVRNALKFSIAGGTVRVRASHDGGHWTIEVADSGIGIPRKDLARITRGFERASNAISAGIPGSGIGLAVCRELVELHGGTLDIRSVVDVGTTVCVRLPDQGGPP